MLNSKTNIRSAAQWKSNSKVKMHTLPLFISIKNNLKVHPTCSMMVWEKLLYNDSNERLKIGRWNVPQVHKYFTIYFGML